MSFSDRVHEALLAEGDDEEARAVSRELLKQLGISVDVLDAPHWTKGEHGLFTGSEPSGGGVTETPAFREWFGNSKVVDANGKPLVVYHGGRSVVDEFKPLSHFGTLAAAHDRLENSRDVRGKEGENVTPAYLSIENPAWLYEDPGLGKASDLATLAVGDNGVRILSAKEISDVGDSENALIEKVKEKGYDGFYYANEVEDPGEEFSYIILDPSQVKSAIGNRGTFDPRSGRLRDEVQWTKGEHGLFTGSEPGSGEVHTQHVDPEQLTGKAILAEPWAKDVKPNSVKVAVLARRLNQRAQDVLQRDIGMPQITFRNHNERTDEYLSNVLAADLKNNLHNGHASDTWYSDKMKEAMGIAETLHPELKGSPDHRFAYTAGLTICSQGETVDRAVALTEEMYPKFRYDPNTGKGKFPTNLATVNPDINDNFKKLNRLVDGMGSVARVKEFFDTEFTVRELEDYTNGILSGKGFTVGKTNKDDKVFGSAILGPKIGQGFYQNLNGNFDPLTMDMWYMRSWGRITGTLVGEADMGPVTKRFQNALRAANKTVPRSEEDLAARAREIFKEHERRFANDPVYRERTKSELALSAQTFVYNHDEGIVETPRGGTERIWMRSVFNRTIDKLATQGIHLTPAAAQATWWSPEQDLYKALGVRVREQSRDYAAGLRKIARAKGITV